MQGKSCIRYIHLPERACLHTTYVSLRHFLTAIMNTFCTESIKGVRKMYYQPRARLTLLVVWIMSATLLRNTANESFILILNSAFGSEFSFNCCYSLIGKLVIFCILAYNCERCLCLTVLVHLCVCYSV